MEYYSIQYALLAMQSALIREVTPELRAVVIDMNKEQEIFYAYFYYDGESSEKMIDLWQCAVTEASASLGPDYFVESEVKRLDYPKKIPSSGYYAYLRKEVNTSEEQRKVEITEMTIGYALLAVQNAMLGVVTPELRAVIVDFDKNGPLLYIRFYYDGEIPDKLVKLWHQTIAKASANFGSDCILDGAVERVDCPQDFDFRGRYAYRRKE